MTPDDICRISEELNALMPGLVLKFAKPFRDMPYNEVLTEQFPPDGYSYGFSFTEAEAHMLGRCTACLEAYKQWPVLGLNQERANAIREIRDALLASAVSRFTGVKSCG